MALGFWDTWILGFTLFSSGWGGAAPDDAVCNLEVVLDSKLLLDKQGSNCEGLCTTSGYMPIVPIPALGGLILVISCMDYCNVD